MNTPTIEPTIFEDARNGNKTFGVRVYDDYGQAYDNTWVFIPTEVICSIIAFIIHIFEE